MRQMCKCENVRCPFHIGRVCDMPAHAKLQWDKIPTGMCNHCLTMATRTHPHLIDGIEPIRAKLLQKSAATGNDTFDRVWSDFHGKMDSDDREFSDVLGEHDAKHQLMIALGKLNYMMTECDGFEDWIAEGYAGTTGDLLLKKLPSHNHEYTVLSEVHGLLREILDAYKDYGVTTYTQLERLLTSGPSRSTLWNWFKTQNKNMFRFRGRVTEPSDLETISGRWGRIRLDDQTLDQELVTQYEQELADAEATLKDGNMPTKEAKKLLDQQAELDSVLEALHYRMTLQKAWNEFRDGGWVSPADDVLNTLNEQYDTLINLDKLVAEAAKLFNETPDEIRSVEYMGEQQAQDT